MVSFSFCMIINMNVPSQNLHVLNNHLYSHAHMCMHGMQQATLYNTQRYNYAVLWLDLKRLPPQLIKILLSFMMPCNTLFPDNQRKDDAEHSSKTG